MLKVAGATNKPKARQVSTSSPSKDGVIYLDPHYQAAKQWLVNGAGYQETAINGNPNAKTRVFGRPVWDYVNGQRGGPVVTYLQTALKRSNFKLQSGVHVQRVARDRGNAYGVVATVNGADVTIPLSANGRVVLSGGAIQSPAILMRSAIGDPAALTKLARANQLGGRNPAAWINNTAIGAGLFDNPNTFIELTSPNVNAFTYSYEAPASAIEKYKAAGGHSGTYTSAGQTSVFWDTVKHADGSVAGMQGTISSTGYQGYTDAHTITLNIYGTSGLKSTGRVIINDQNLPGPDGNVYYSNPQDAQDIAVFIRRLFDALPKSSFTPRNIARTATVEQIRQYITTPSVYARGMVNHWSSSCRFGGCVDTNTKVKGMNNLHVVDASIIPPLTVNPQMGVMIAAERASELILKL